MGAEGRRRLVPALVLLALLLPGPAFAQSGQNVLVVINDASPVSEKIADRYARARGVPQDNLVRIKVDAKDDISRPDYERLIELPLAQWLGKHAAHDRILFIVLTKSIPLRIAGTAGRAGTTASVDSELSLLYRRMSGAAVSIAGRVDNPYYLGETPPSGPGIPPVRPEPVEGRQ